MYNLINESDIVWKFNYSSLQRGLFPEINSIIIKRMTFGVVENFEHILAGGEFLNWSPRRNMYLIHFELGEVNYSRLVS